jgi:hypothetical protein
MWAPTLLLGSCPKLARSYPKMAPQYALTDAHHVLGELSQRVTRALGVAAMQGCRAPSTLPHVSACLSHWEWMSYHRRPSLVPELASAFYLAPWCPLAQNAAMTAMDSRPSSMATNQSAPPHLPYPNRIPPHLHGHMPPSKRPFSGLFCHRGRPPPELLARSRLHPWPRGHGPPHAKP